MLRVLVLTDFFTGWTGSEIVAMEVAEHFGATTSSFVALDPALSALDDWRPLDEIKLADFDMVWAQHHTIVPLLDKHVGDRRPFIVFASLSPHETMETLPPGIRNEYVDLRVANSAETAQMRGADLVIQNAAPPSFHFMRESREGTLRILFVSNRQPPEMVEAADILRANGADIRFIGEGKDFRRLTPSDIAWADSVVTIGKTVRYALASGTPVFVYDHFGGDGYLTGENYDLNESHNFSGRPNGRKLSAEQLATEILGIPNWKPPPQPRLSDILDGIDSEPKAFVRHQDLTAIADICVSLGRFISAHAHKCVEARDFKRYFDGEAGGWKWLVFVARKKFRRSLKKSR